MLPQQNGRGLVETDYRLLKTTALFAGLADDALEQMFKGGYVICHSKGYQLFAQGDKAERFYIVIDGWVKLCRYKEDGSETVIGVFTNGEVFAEAAIFEAKTYPVTAEIVEETKLLTVPAQSIINAVTAKPELALNMMAAMSRHLRSMVFKMEQMGTQSTVQRLATFMLSHCKRNEGTASFTLPHDKGLIAGRLGMQPESLSRALAKLKKHGVAVRKNEVSVADISVLKNLLE